MSFDEAKQLLARIAVLDNRTVDSITVQMWAEVLGTYTLAECSWALREFARTNTSDYLRPAHLIQIVNTKRAEYAWSNPGRVGKRADDWLIMEQAQEVVAAECRAIRASGVRYAADAIAEITP